MENFDFGKAINIFLVVFVIFIVVMIAFVARLVSTFMVRKNSTPLTATYANQETAETPIETLHTTTVSLNNLGEEYILGTGQEKQEMYEVLLTIAEARKQAFVA